MKEDWKFGHEAERDSEILIFPHATQKQTPEKGNQGPQKSKEKYTL